MAALLVGLLTAAGATAASRTTSAKAPSFGEHYTPSNAIMMKSMGTTRHVPDVFKAALYRAEQPLSAAKLTLALKCWKQNVCSTGTGGKLTVGMVDGFGENVWRQVTHMELILQALTYPDVGKIMYSSARLDAQKSISDIRSMIAQGADVIVGFPDFGNGVLAPIKEATAKGIPFIPYASGIVGEPGMDYPGVVGEDLCLVGKSFARVLNGQAKTGTVVFLGGTPGNPLSAGWQTCEKPALATGLKFGGDAATYWTREGALTATAGYLSKYPDLAGISYEYADGFLGALTAYQNANKAAKRRRHDPDRRDRAVLRVEEAQQPELQALPRVRAELPVTGRADRGNDEAQGSNDPGQDEHAVRVQEDHERRLRHVHPGRGFAIEPRAAEADGTDVSQEVEMRPKGTN